ncbi:hypothetical protein, partial [Nocardia farcinica]|uniref:hypothetical protein n=1 Tax=Nocardia farcinica TaxID=37329 RepID=UPI00245804F7
SEIASVYFTVRMRDTLTGGPVLAAILSYTADENRRLFERLLAEASHTWAAAHEPPLPLWYRRLLGSEAPTPVRLREIERAAPERPVPGGRAA